MYRRVSLLICLMVFATEVFGDSDRQIRILKKIPVANIQIPFIIGSVKCNADQDFFLQLAGTRGITRGSILKVQADGQKVVTYSLDSVPDLVGSDIEDFAPSGSDLFLLVHGNMDEQYLVLFDDDAKYKSRSRISEQVRPLHIAALSEQMLFISGRELESKDGVSGNAAPFIAIFGSDGQLMRRVESTNDIAAFGGKSASKSGAQELLREPTKRNVTDKKYQKALALSIAQSGQDGKVYLLRRSESSPLFVVSAGGELKDIPLKVPEGAIPVNVKLGHSEGAVEYLKVKPDGENIEKAFLQVVNLSDGREKAEYYHSNPEIGASLACYSEGPDFVFASVDEENHLSILHAGPE